MDSPINAEFLWKSNWSSTHMSTWMLSHKCLPYDLQIVNSTLNPVFITRWSIDLATNCHPVTVITPKRRDVCFFLHRRPSLPVSDPIWCSEILFFVHEANACPSFSFHSSALFHVEVDDWVNTTNVRLNKGYCVVLGRRLCSWFVYSSTGHRVESSYELWT